MLSETRQTNYLVDPFKTIAHASNILEFWFSTAISQQLENWEVGRSKREGGAIGMNDSVVAIVNTLRGAFQIETKKGCRIYEMSEADVRKMLQPYADALANGFGLMNKEALAEYRSPRGAQGQIERTRRLQVMIRERIPTFSPGGLDEWLKSHDKNTLALVRDCVDSVELSLKDHIVSTLKANFGNAENEWFFKIPKSIQKRINDEITDDDFASPKGTKFTLIDYRTIATDKWLLFSETLGEGNGNASKEKRTAWMARVNEIRQKAEQLTKIYVS
jgi:DNA sulfur modification protein DndB